MKNRLEYKGYVGSVEYSTEDELLYGRILNIRDVVTYEGESVAELKEHFTQAVEGYLRLCADLQQEPDRPASGRFLVRISPELHRDAQMRAIQENRSINEVMTQALEKLLHGG